MKSETLFARLNRLCPISEETKDMDCASSLRGSSAAATKLSIISLSLKDFEFVYENE